MENPEITAKDEAWFDQPEKRAAAKKTGEAVDAAVHRGTVTHEAEASLDEAIARGVEDTDAESVSEETKEKAA